MRTLGLALGLEWLVGDPRSAWHPVALFGSAAQRIENVLYRDTRGAGCVAWAFAVVLPSALLAVILRWLHAESPWAESAVGAVAVWATLGWRSLLEHVSDVADAHDLETARERVGWLVGRDVDQLDEAEVRRAALESLAENAADGVVAPLCWACLGGPVGAVAYRTINTLDAMWGHRSERFRRFGWAAARADDVASWLPSRLCALVYLGAGRVSPSAVARVRTEAKGHPSWNAGWPESAMAHALGIRLGGVVSRSGVREERPWMGPDGAPDPTADDVGRALRLTNRGFVFVAAVVLAVRWSWS